MRASPLLAVLVLTASLGGCAAMVAGEASFSGPPEWFLREDEKARLAEAQAAARPDEARFAAPTALGVAEYAERLAGVAESCWVRGEAGWRVARPAPEIVRLEEIAAEGAPPRVALSLSVEKAATPGLTVRASGPLAAHRARIQAALQRAGEDGAPCG